MTAGRNKLYPTWQDHMLAGAVVLAGLTLAAYYRSRDGLKFVPVHAPLRAPASGPHAWAFIVVWAVTFARMPDTGHAMAAAATWALVALRLGGSRAWRLGVLVALTAMLLELAWLRPTVLAALGDLWGPLDIHRRHHEHGEVLKLLGNSSVLGPVDAFIGWHINRGLGPYGRDWALQAMQITGYAPVACLLIAWTMGVTWLAARLSWGQPSASPSWPWLQPLAASLLWMQAAVGGVYVLWVFGWLRQPFSPGLAPWVGHAGWGLIGLVTLALVWYTGVPQRSNDEPVPWWRQPRLWLVASAAFLVIAVVAGKFLAPVPASAPAPTPAEKSRPQPQPLPLPDINTFKSKEIGDWIRALMPTDARHLRWDQLANDSVHWLDSPTRSEGQWPSVRSKEIRTGLLRTHVLGQQATELRQKKDELWWTLRYETQNDTKFGVDKITLRPGLPWGQCWGEHHDGCDFKIRDSLRRAGIGVETICDNVSLGFHSAVLRLRYPKRASVILKWRYDYGSGGADAGIEIFKSEEKIDCEP